MVVSLTLSTASSRDKRGFIGKTGATKQTIVFHVH